MPSFIQRVVKTLINNNTNWATTRIILPGKRPALQFRKAFEQEGYSGILPEFLSLQQFVQEISERQLMPSYTLCLTAYTKYVEIVKEEPDELQKFLQWFPTLLKDFDDIDAQLCNTKELFEYLTSVERIEQWGKSEMVEKQLLFWEMAEKLYAQFNASLAASNTAYAGANSRQAVDQMQHYFAKDQYHYVICGFNALTASEIALFKYMQEKDKAQFFWHTDAYYLDNKNQEAGNFLRQNAKWTNIESFVDSDFVKPKTIIKIGAAEKIAQAKAVGSLLADLSEKEHQKTGLVLGDEVLLPLILDALPSSVERANVTMGLPIHAFPHINWWQKVLDFHDPNKRNPDAREVQNTFWTDEPNQHTFPANGENGTGIFMPFSSVSFFLDSAVALIDAFYDRNRNDVFSSNLALRLRSVLVNLKKASLDFPFFTDFSALNVVFKQLVRTETLDFIGEPLSGLQISGMLETRLLEYPRVILSSVNEGVLPLGKRENSFISYSIRKQFGMYTYSENDAVYAYHFYRLIQAAKEVYLIYDVSDSGMGAGEQSRFITQMEFESPHPIQKQIAQVNKPKKSFEPKQIRRTPGLTKLLVEEWASRKISPSSLKSYNYNAYNFIAEKILRITFTKDTVLHSLLGNVVHDTLERIYAPHLNQQITTILIDSCKEELPRVFDEVIREHLGEKQILSTEEVLLKDVALGFLHRQLKWDRELAKENWVLKGLEVQAETILELSTGKQIVLAGKIDRIDEVNGTTFLVDYKTGNAKLNKSFSLEDGLADVFRKKEQESLLQLACYAVMYHGMYPNATIGMKLYGLKKGEIIKPSLRSKEKSRESEVLGAFRAEIISLIEEIIYTQEIFAETYSDLDDEQGDAKFD